MTLRITVADSAVFNENSYPPIPYMEIMKAPDRYEGAQIGLLGKVIAVTGQDGDDTVFERKPMKQLAVEGQLMSYLYKGFWQCMDTQREKDILDKLLQEGKAPWVKWEV